MGENVEGETQQGETAAASNKQQCSQGYTCSEKQCGLIQQQAYTVCVDLGRNRSIKEKSKNNTESCLVFNEKEQHATLQTCREDCLIAAAATAAPCLATLAGATSSLDQIVPALRGCISCRNSAS